MLTQSLAGLPAFLAYFAVAIGSFVLFVLMYVGITLYRELSLIRRGNAAARLLLPDLARDIPAGKVAPGVFLGALYAGGRDTQRRLYDLLNEAGDRSA